MVEHTTEGCSCKGKKCSQCKKIKCVDDFYRNGKYLRSNCIPCKLEADKVFRDTNAKSINAKRRARRPERAEIIKAQQKASYQVHGKARRERRKLRMAQDPEYAERQRATARKSREKRRDVINARMRTPAFRVKAREYDKKRYQKSNTRRLWQQAYRENNPGLFRSYYRVSAHRKRARKAQTGGSFTSQEWEALKAACNYTCPSCGRIEPDISLNVDHIIPLSRGGSSYISNIQPLCASCNARKGTKIIDYRRFHYE